MHQLQTVIWELYSGIPVLLYYKICHQCQYLLFWNTLYFLVKESTNFQKVQNCTRPTLPSEEMILLSENLLCLLCWNPNKCVSWLKLSTLLKSHTKSCKVQSIANWDILVEGVDLLKYDYGLCRRMFLCFFS